MLSSYVHGQQQGRDQPRQTFRRLRLALDALHEGNFGGLLLALVACDGKLRWVLARARSGAIASLGGRLLALEPRR